MSCLVHKLAYGFGGMGDGYVCVKCGLASYWRPFNAVELPQRNDMMHFREYPFIRLFPDAISWSVNLDDWTHYYDRKGNLQLREKEPEHVDKYCGF
jgi:hypothetical protein